MSRRPSAESFDLTGARTLGVVIPAAPAAPGKPPRRAKVARPLEKVVQAQVLAVLRANGVWCMRNNTGALAVGEGRSRRFIKFSEAGAADVLFRMPDGRMGWVEIKRQGQKPTADQLAWLLEQQAGGAVAIWTHDADDFRCVLGVLLRGGKARLQADGSMSVTVDP